MVTISYKKWEFLDSGWNDAHVMTFWTPVSFETFATRMANHYCIRIIHTV